MSRHRHWVKMYIIHAAGISYCQAGGAHARGTLDGQNRTRANQYAHATAPPCTSVTTSTLPLPPSLLSRRNSAVPAAAVRTHMPACTHTVPLMLLQQTRCPRAQHQIVQCRGPGGRHSQPARMGWLLQVQQQPPFGPAGLREGCANV
jgi:hypothetical protein